jgi:hypothetical protein
MWDDFPELKPYYRSGEHTLALPNGSKLFFDACENAGDVERKAFGPEFMDIAVDQAEQFEERELKQLKTTCRWPGMPEHKCKFLLGFNPGGRGAGFLQRVFSTKDFHEREIPEDFVFLQAYGWDNVEWCRFPLEDDGLSIEDFYSWDNDKRFQYFITRSQYGQELNRLDATMRPGQLLGDFTRFAGQYFSNWNRAEHVVDLTSIKLQPWWPRWISIDWGYQHHTAVYWHIQVGTKEETGKDRPLTVTYREYLVNHLSERALGEEIVRRNDGERIQNVYGGHDLWEKDTTDKTKEAQISSVLTANGLPSVKKALVDRVNGWRLMHLMLDEGEWLISEDCPEAIRAMPTAIYDEKKDNEDVLKTKDVQDDIRDCLRYGIYSQFGTSEPPWEVKLNKAISHLTDPTNRAIHALKLASGREREVRNLGVANLRSTARQRFTR